jgi:mannose-6-phosphate isomerase-like protein (cupin superfamily)
MGKAEVESGWRVARLGELPHPRQLQPPDDGVSDEEREEARAELRDDDDAVWDPPGYPAVARNWRAIRQHFGITAFGVGANEADAGQALFVAHTEAQYGHEELYLVLEGRARFFCDDDEFELGRDEMVYVRPGVRRGAVALETPTVLLAIGGVPGSYEPPVWAPDWRPPQDWLDRKRA